MKNTMKSLAINLRPEYEWLIQAMLVEEKDLSFEQLSNDIDWSLLVELSETHGMMPLMYQYLHHYHSENTPEAILTDLEHRYKANELRNRILTQELVKIFEHFDNHGIRILAYKGPTLTISFYGDLALRQFGDLDVLIDTHDVQDACKHLSDMGYQRITPALSPAQEKDFIRTDHEHEFVSPDGLVNIDLHWALSTRRFPFQMQTEQLFSRSKLLSLAAGKLEHISDQDLLLLLCMHSNKDLWRKLVWVCDIDRLVRTRKEINWESLIQQAISSHCEQMLYVSLLITHSLMQTPIPDYILSTAQEKKYNHLAKQAMSLCLEEINKPTYKQCLSIEPFILSLCDSRADQISYIIRSLITPNENDMAQHNLPSYLHFLYYFIRPTRKLLFCSARAIKRFFIAS